MTAAVDLRKHLEQSFAFLFNEFGFDKESLSQTEGEDEISIQFKSKTVGVRIILDLRDQYPFVFISELTENKEFPEKLGEITPNTEIHEFDLDDIVWIQSREEPYSHSSGLDLTKGIKEQAKKLKKYGKDVLSGDFDVFNDLDEIVKERAHEAASNKWGSSHAKKLC